MEPFERTVFTWLGAFIIGTLLLVLIHFFNVCTVVPGSFPEFDIISGFCLTLAACNPLAIPGVILYHYFVKYVWKTEITAWKKKLVLAIFAPNLVFVLIFIIILPFTGFEKIEDELISHGGFLIPYVATLVVFQLVNCYPDH